MPRSAQRHGSPRPSNSIPTTMEDTPAARVASSSSLKDLGTDSDPDNRERPVREKLQKTSIDSLPSEAIPSDRAMPDANEKTAAVPSEDAEVSSGDNSSRGRVRRKRSYEDMDAGVEIAANKPDRHARKKSRDMGSTRLENDTRHVPGEAIAEESTEQGGNSLLQSIESNGGIMDSGAKTINGDTARPTTPLTETEAKDSIVSPKNKRNRDQFLRDSSAGNAVSEKKNIDETVKDELVEEPKVKVGEEPKSKRQRDSGSPQPIAPDNESTTDKKNPTGGFANTSVKSPFGALSENKSTQAQTSTSAFASSAFGSLSSSTTSPFGALSASKSSKSPFASASEKKSPTFASSATTPSTFGGALGGGEKSSFASASATSGFGSLGGKNFGSVFGNTTTASRLTSFAGGTGPSITGLGTKSSKPFGANADDGDEDEGSDGDDEEPDAQSPSEDKKDPRFHQQEISTGEEAEDEIFKCRAKLYNYTNVSENSDRKEWKERGVGDLKLLVPRGKVDASDDAGKGRFVMRADKSHRLLLNSPILKNGKYGTSEGEMPKNGYLLFMGTIDEKPVELLQIKMKPANAEDMWKQISELQKEM